MSDNSYVHLAAIHRYDLGVVICKNCNRIITSVPTGGVAKIYGLCNTAECRQSVNERFDTTGR